MADKPRAPFKSGVTNFDELGKRVKELGIRPIYHTEDDTRTTNNGVVVPPVEPNAPITTGITPDGYYY